MPTTESTPETPLKIIAYTSLKDSGIDSAIALVEDPERGLVDNPAIEVILASIGPGFWPEGSERGGKNKGGYAWGDCMIVDRPIVISTNLSKLCDMEDMGEFDYPIKEFDAWDDDERVKALILEVITGFYL